MASPSPPPPPLPPPEDDNDDDDENMIELQPLAEREATVTSGGRVCRVCLQHAQNLPLYIPCRCTVSDPVHGSIWSHVVCSAGAVRAGLHCPRCKHPYRAYRSSMSEAIDSVGRVLIGGLLCLVAILLLVFALVMLKLLMHAVSGQWQWHIFGADVVWEPSLADIVLCIPLLLGLAGGALSALAVHFSVDRYRHWRLRANYNRLRSSAEPRDSFVPTDIDEEDGVDSGRRRLPSPAAAAGTTRGTGWIPWR